MTTENRYWGVGDNLCLTTVIWIVTYLLGVAFICFLPPWEGYDEVAHYSYAQQLADTGEAPSLQQGRLAKGVESYKRLAPMPYSTTLPFDENGGVTYRSWFSQGDASKALAHGQNAHKRFFSPGTASNWQAQHPALYYRLLAPLVSMTADLSWAAQLFILRLMSWSLAFTGLVISLWSTARAINVIRPELNGVYARIALAWPLLFPGFFPEFARLGNDSLVLLLLSMVWALLVQFLITPLRLYWYLGLGVLLGLGGLTKVTFLPISAAIFGWLLWMGALAPGWKQRIRSWSGALLVIAIYFVFTGEGYLTNLEQRRSLSGLVELSGSQAPSASFWFGAFQHPIEVIKGVLGIGMTFVWGGTASSAYPPVLFVLPAVLWFVALVGCSVDVLKGRSRDLAILALLIVATVTGGLIYYLLVRIAVTGVGAGAPGWYLHTLIAPMSLLLAGGWHFIQARISFSRAIWRIWLIYMVCFGLGIGWLQLTLFTGCSFKTADSRTYSFSDPVCLVDAPRLYQRLDMLTYPAPGFLLLGLALSLISWVVWYSRNASANKDTR
ncbi:hypothetical protein NA643_17055 [Pseudomonas stutzeri]|uniref:hypothetical protein n=1 Tax=Stutzerimonas stutzeri TaxID=316 RepID=UPI000C9B10C6|nr:hypothetical protein [Stutzerimonas stutzeri]MCQ4280804.1 hypothetical protein [Stutzerimonas stutzeri]PNF74493.1 hypothetical protein CXK96_01055 [Stutzerimonas stutzeri]